MGPRNQKTRCSPKNYWCYAILVGYHRVSISCRWSVDISMVSYQKGPTRHAYAWQIGPFCQDTLDFAKMADEISREYRAISRIKPMHTVCCCHSMSDWVWMIAIKTALHRLHFHCCGFHIHEGSVVLWKWHARALPWEKPCHIRPRACNPPLNTTRKSGHNNTDF